MRYDHGYVAEIVSFSLSMHILGNAEEDSRTLQKALVDLI